MKLRVAIVVWDLSVSGGTQRQALELAQQLLDSGVSVDIYCQVLDHKLCYPKLTKNLHIVSPAKIAGAQVLNSQRALIRLRLANTGIFRLLDVDYWSYHTRDGQVRQLADLMGHENYDVVNAHDSPAHKVIALYKKRHPESKTVWMSNDMPWIFQFLEQYRAPKGEQHLMYWLSSLFLRYEKMRESKVANKINEIVVLDNRNKKLFQKFLHRTPKVVRSGLDTKHFYPVLKKNNRIFTILATGIFFRYRRFEDLIKAVGMLKQKGLKLKLNIIGSDQFDPGYGKELAAQVKRLKLSNEVSFLGRVSEEDLLDNYKGADVFVFPNHNQTWGLAPFEAMASGTPVIVSRTAGAHEVLSDGKNALLINPLEPRDIADKLELLYNDGELRQQLAKQGLSYVNKNMSWQLYAKNMLKVFKELTG